MADPPPGDSRYSATPSLMRPRFTPSALAVSSTQLPPAGVGAAM